VVRFDSVIHQSFKLCNVGTKKKRINLYFNKLTLLNVGRAGFPTTPTLPGIIDVSFCQLCQLLSSLRTYCHFLDYLIINCTRICMNKNAKLLILQITQKLLGNFRFYLTKHLQFWLTE